YAPPGQGNYGPPPMMGGARCVQGHPIPPGGSFCMDGGHPIEGGADQFGATGFAQNSPVSDYGQQQSRPGPPPPIQQPPTPQPQPQPPKAAPAGADGRRALAGFL